MSKQATPRRAPGQRGEGRRCGPSASRPQQARPGRTATIRGKKASSRRSNELHLLASKRIAIDVKKCARDSAIANAENNHNLDVDRPGRCRGVRSARRIVHEAFPRRAAAVKAAGIKKPFSESHHRGARSPNRRSGKTEDQVNGSEGKSDRPASRHQPDLGLSLVRRQGAEYSTMLHEDIEIRKPCCMKSPQPGGRVAKIVIERPATARNAASRSTPPVRAW